MKSHAFSLIEIIICVAIISILVSIGVVSYQGSVDSSELKNVVPALLLHLKDCDKTAKENKVKVVVEFLIGTGKVRISIGRGSETVAISERDFNKTGILKRKLLFRSYRWPDGSRSPATFTYFPDAQPQGGEVRFGSGFAEARIYLRGDTAVSDF